MPMIPSTEKYLYLSALQQKETDQEIIQDTKSKKYSFSNQRKRESGKTLDDCSNFDYVSFNDNKFQNPQSNIEYYYPKNYSSNKDCYKSGCDVTF